MRGTSSRILNLAVLLAMLLSFVTGPVGAANAASSPSDATVSDITATGFTPGNLVIYRVGDGSTGLTSSGTKVFLDEYSPAGNLVQSIEMPSTATAPNYALLANGTSSAEGFLTRSTDGQYLLLGGYNTTIGSPTSSSSPATTPRVVGRIDSTGNIDTSTALTDLAGNIRSATSTNGIDLWATSSSSGIRYVTIGGSTSVQLSSSPTNIRQTNIFNGQLYISSGATGFRLATVGTGIPTTNGQTTTNLPGYPTGSGSPYGFFFADLSAAVEGVDTLYVADDATGLLKYSLVSGTWTSNGLIGSSTDAYRGLTGVVNGTTVTLYATRKGGTSATGGGELVSLVDTTGYTGAFSGTPTPLASAATNTAFRGVAFAPVPATPVDAAPTVQSTVPASGAENVSVSDSITVTFSEDVTTTQAAFALSCDGVNQPFAFSGTGAVYTLDPTGDLPNSKVCTVTVNASGVTDLDGTIDPMAADYTWNFTTVSLAPSVISTTPAADATKVAVETDLTVTFNRDVTITADAFGITCGGADQPFALSGTGAVYTLNPDSNLPYSQVCSVTVFASQVPGMAADKTWSFTTTYDPDAITPISEARAAGAGWTGTIQGNVTAPPGIYRSNAFSIQDATGGMYIFTGSLSLPAMALGDVVKVKGTIKNYGGMLETDPTLSVTVMGPGTVPDPLSVSTSAVLGTEGKLIVVSGTASWTTTPPTPGASNFSFTINDSTGPVTIYVYKTSGIDMRGFTSGQQMRVVGYSSMYNTSPQIYPRYQTDIIDLRPPVVSATIPEDAATGISPHRPVSATFNKAMDPLTLNPSSFTLTKDSNASAVDGAVTYDDSTHTAVFTPAAALEPNTSYTARLTTAVTDSYGVPMAAEKTWSFTTGELDITSPTILTRSPEDGDVDVPISAPVAVTFSEDIAPTSLDLSHFILTGPSGVVPATLNYDPATFIVTLTPDENLLYSTQYTMTVAAGTADYAGNPLGTVDDTWTFTTSAEPPMQVYFGDLHNHTSYSDGSGTPAQALAAGKAAGFDFMAISDHSYAIDDAEWANTLTAVNNATTSDFVALRGFEYTQGAEGHINVWNSTRHATRTDTGCANCDYTPNLEAGSTVNGFYAWLASASNVGLDSSGTVMQFNHPGWINFNDWYYHSEPKVSEIARLEEVGNGSGSSYVFSEEEYIRSLDYGWKLGATNNADTHSASWGMNTDHRTGVLMTGLTKAALMDALRQRRTFATEDKNFSLTMKANGAWMGSEIANTGQIAFVITGTDPDGEIPSLVELITDQGKTLLSEQPTAASFTWQPTINNVSAGVHYFYVKVTQADGDKIVSSPVWTLGTEDIAITDITIQPTIPTVYNPSLLMVRVTNRVAESRTVTVSIEVNETSLGAAKEVIVPANGDGYVYFNWQPTATGAAHVNAIMQGAPIEDNPDDNSASLDLTVTDEHLPLILIDAGHGNMNASGNEMKAFIDDLSAHHYNVLKNLDALTAEDLNPDVVKLLIITAPENAYTADEQTAIANFVAAGGSLWIGGLADYNKSLTWANTVADRENAILDRVETVTGQQINMRMNDDEVIDGDTNNGYVFGVIWQDFPSVESTGIGLNVENVSTWSLSSIRGRTVNDPLTASTPGVQIVMQGDLDVGCSSDSYKNPYHTSNTDYDQEHDAYIYNPSYTCDLTQQPADAIPLPGAAVTQLNGGAGRIMLYGDSNDPFTTFAYTAGDGKQNELFNLQSIMWLLGSPLQKSTIAEARAQAVDDQPDNLNRLVWVEGDITAAYGEFFNVLYVQDETGGITVHAPAGDIDSSTFTRGKHVRVVGTIDTYNGDTEIQFFEAEMVQVIDTAINNPAPLPLSTHDATLEASEGWLATVTGRVTQKMGTDTIFVDDGTGPIRVFLDGYNGTFADILVNDRVQVTGLVSEDGDGARIRVRNYKFHAGVSDDVTVLGQYKMLYLPVIMK